MFKTIFKEIRRAISRYNDWVLGFASRKDVEKALGLFSFAESSFFPLPIDPLLAAAVSARPTKVKRLVIIAGTTSVIGGLFGYLVGALLMGTIGTAIIEFYGAQDAFATMGRNYEQFAFLAVLVGAFTPIPYKVISISAGAFLISLPAFILGSIVGRFGRYALVGWLSRIVGTRYKEKITHYINLLSLAVIVLFVLVILSSSLV